MWPKLSTDLPEFAEAEAGVQKEIDRLMGIQGKRSVDSIHKELGHILWEHVGMGRTKEGLEEGLKKMKALREEFNKNLFIPGKKEGLNVELDKAIHLRDFILMGELIAYDALHRNESCGGHFREEYQTEEGEAKRDDEHFFYVGCWEYQGNDTTAPVLNKEPLEYEDEVRTPMEEHLVEAALYASSNGEANVHFTVSHDHLELFKQMVAEKADKYAQRYGIKYNISFSEQKPSTDTIAANPDNTPFRNEDGSLLFRPGGHGALIENLNEIDADVVFIKNIDNVVPDRLKAETVTWKQVIAGVLVTLQKQAFDYLKVLDSGQYNHEKLEEIIRFVQRDLCCRKADIKELEDAEGHVNVFNVVFTA